MQGLDCVATGMGGTRGRVAQCTLNWGGASVPVGTLGRHMSCINSFQCDSIRKGQPSTRRAALGCFQMGEQHTACCTERTLSVGGVTL